MESESADVVQAFGEVGGVLVWVWEDLRAEGLVVGAYFWEEGVEVAADDVGSLRLAY